MRDRGGLDAKSGPRVMRFETTQREMQSVNALDPARKMSILRSPKTSSSVTARADKRPNGIFVHSTVWVAARRRMAT
jgi:hypothetical protein